MTMIEVQMTMIILHLHVSGSDVTVFEHFTGFIHVKSSTPSSLTESVLQKLNELGLDSSNCEDRGYDNGANMAGKKNGLQNKILQLNPQARFVPCSCHSLNLVLSDCAKSNVTFMTFFGSLQKLYSKLSASTKKWQILKQHCPLVVKYPSETRWESKIASVKVVRFHLVGIAKALYEILCESSDASDCADIEGLLHNLASFESLVSCAIWYNVLSKVSFVSKSLQAIDMQVDKAIILISSACSWIQEFRPNGFSQVLHEAREIADLINSQCDFITVATEFEQHRV